MDVELVLAGDPVNLGDGLVFRQAANHFGQGVGPRLDLKVAGHRPADLLGVHNGGVFLNDPTLLQSLNPGFHRHPGNPHRLPDVRIGHPGVFDQKPDNLLVQLVQSFQEHGCQPPSLGAFRPLMSTVYHPRLQKETAR